VSEGERELCLIEKQQVHGFYKGGQAIYTYAHSYGGQRLAGFPFCLNCESQGGARD
jgi:hypothetical protein